MKGIKPDFSNFKSEISNANGFIDFLKHFDVSKMSASTLKKVNKELQSPDFNFDSIKR
jgi:hypothetical protein